MARLARMLRPRSVAVIGGGFWARDVLLQCQAQGFAGEIWPVHPSKPEIAGLKAFARVEDLPAPPDVAYIAVNRHATIEIVGQLADGGAGGAVCFASGYSEAAAEDSAAVDLQAQLLAAAGAMPIIGPNCYGYLNYLDGVALWPDQHGGARVERGVAILTQSSNIALNLTMQRRGLPLAYVGTLGNQAQIGMSDFGAELLTDPRVTALGLHIEGIDDLRAFEALANTARGLGKPIVALKVGASDAAQAATISHTASLAGSQAGASALLRRLGIAEVSTLPELLECLKLLHVTGPLSSNRIASMSCSGGEASLIADMALGSALEFPALSPGQKERLRAALGPMVALSNPLDYHTYIWNDQEGMSAAYTAMMEDDLGAVCVIADYPRADRCAQRGWDMIVPAAKLAAAGSKAAMVVVSSLPETMPEDVAVEAIAAGIAPMSGLSELHVALERAAWLGTERAVPGPVWLPEPADETQVLGEADAKHALAQFGAGVPMSRRAGSANEAAQAAEALGFPVVLKGEGLAHKTEAGAVALNLGSAAAVAEAARRMGAESFLVEEMVRGAVAELLVGVVCDAAHGYVLTLGAGGTLTEIMGDTVSLLLPASDADIADALSRLRIAPLLQGYRGAPPASIPAILQAVRAVQNYVSTHRGRLAEIEINPLMCLPDQAIVADALIRTGPPHE